MIQSLDEKNSMCWHTARMCVSTYHLMRFWFSFLSLYFHNAVQPLCLFFLRCYQSCPESSIVDFLLFLCVVVLCTLVSTDFSPLHPKLAAAGRFSPPPPPPCFFFSWQLCQGPHIEEVEQGCCAILVDRLTYISQPTVYFCSIIIYLPGRQNGGKLGCAEAGARKAQGPTRMTSISLLAHSSHSLRPHHAGPLCRGLPVGPLPETQSTATDDWPWDKGSRMGPLSSAGPQEDTGTKYCFPEKLQKTFAVLQPCTHCFPDI